MDDMVSWSSRLANWDEAAPRLRIATYTDAWMASHPGALRMPRVFDGLVPALAIDLPRTVALVHEQHPGLWGVTRREIETRALMNTMAEPSTVEASEVAGIPFVGVFGAHPYVPLHANTPERHLPGLDARGALVAIPAEDVVVLHRVGEVEVERALMAMGAAVGNFFSRAEQPRSRNLYWYRPGQRSLYVGAGSSERVGGITLAATLDDEVVEMLKAVTASTQ